MNNEQRKDKTHMRKSTATALLFTLLLTFGASAAPNDSSDRGAGPITRIIHFLKHFMIHAFDEGQPNVPIP